MADDIFCKIISGEIKGDFLYRDDTVVVIKDINPHAPVHLLVIPVEHHDGVAGAPESLIGHMIAVAHQIADKQGLSKGYRFIINQGEDGGQRVPHLHMHMLGGKPLGPKLVES